MTSPMSDLTVKLMVTLTREDGTRVELSDYCSRLLVFLLDASPDETAEITVSLEETQTRRQWLGYYLASGETVELSFKDGSKARIARDAIILFLDANVATVGDVE